MAKSTDELHWRETYFIVFPQDRRPPLDEVVKALAQANPRYALENLSADEAGLIQSIFVESDEDHAAVEISYEVGDSVIEQNLEWAKQLQDELPPSQLRELVAADARLDVAHFERMPAGSADSSEAPSALGEGLSAEGIGSGGFGDGEFGDEEENFDMLDPTCLLTVVDALAQLTDGLTFDPASGEIL
ncbi:MAG: hypothetical protein AAGD11_04945 [Planctomycetota bacterium]